MSPQVWLPKRPSFNVSCQSLLLSSHKLMNIGKPNQKKKKKKVERQRMKDCPCASNGIHWALWWILYSVLIFSHFAKDTAKYHQRPSSTCQLLFGNSVPSQPDVSRYKGWLVAEPDTWLAGHDTMGPLIFGNSAALILCPYQLCDLDKVTSLDLSNITYPVDSF